MSKPPSRPKIQLDVFQTVNKLIDQKHFSVAEVSSILKVKLKKTEKRKYFTSYELESWNNFIKSLDLRLPNELSEKKDGMIIIEFSDSLNIYLDDLYVEYGKDTWSFHPAPPEAPLTSPHYHTKVIKGQEVTFGIDRDSYKLR